MQTNKPIDWMRLALKEAHKALYLSDPNPRVGAVLVNENNQCIGIGHTQKTGEAHAEVMALRDAKCQGHSTVGATIYVTLEPCSHFGRTPPCAKSLIDAGIRKVVIAALDPNPLVAGNGVRTLREAGITVEHGLLADDSKELNIGFFSRMECGLPWVRLKMATSLDGKTALNNGESQWITLTEARNDGHAWRGRASSIMTGIGTILADDPQLNVRALEVEKQPWHAILDPNLATPTQAKIFNNKTPVVIYTNGAESHKRSALEAAGATICRVDLNPEGRLDLKQILADLGQRDCNELHVEAGSILSTALLKANLVDELLVYIAPRLIGEGKSFIQGIELESLENTIDFRFHRIDPIKGDLRLLLRKNI